MFTDPDDGDPFWYAASEISVALTDSVTSPTLSSTGATATVAELCPADICTVPESVA